MTSITCHFWNAGQGLFSSGKIALPNNKEFVWVYDCGSTSQNPKHLTNAISAMKQTYPNPEINLLVISHFDQDHINGLDQLLQNRKVKTLWLPYYPLYQRLAIAQYLKINETSDELIECYISPVKYFTEKYHIEQILFVSENLDQIDEYPLDRQELSNSKNPNTKVSFFNSKKDSLISDIEFVPYNVPFYFLKRSLKNVKLSENQINKIWQNRTITINDRINAIKNYYYQTLSIQGKGNSKPRNKLSLYLYIGKVAPKTFHTIAYQHKNIHRFLFANNIWNPQCLNPVIKDSILYCGDGYLDIKKRLNHIEKSLTSERMKRIACLQVPHHGSRSNWNVGLSSNYIQPNISVFCADPKAGYKHPHPDIIFDFIHQNPILVDTSNLLTIHFQ